MSTATPLATTPRPLSSPGPPGTPTARDLHVLGRNLPALLIQVGLQPLLFTFAFAYVMPSTGSGLGGATSFSTVLLPGLIASTLTLQSIMSVTGPLAAELGPGREITDRALAPLPVWALGLQCHAAHSPLAVREPTRTAVHHGCE
ncbi:hypothetical protein B7755_049385 [Streptomyces sp. NBS 14/10]|uniref:hypothetical protein n=1 Tax=Streptomyces sp. NBS 14/10 TaxID=1945643 RepID=UPI000B7FB96B|nr:hypothetical protein [Streptomyces sp. NBS 14/10]KAK1185399.1 hypothetical protein B7755_049385 [Streptomyces sp. NBS 14/10]